MSTCRADHEDRYCTRLAVVVVTALPPGDVDPVVYEVCRPCVRRTKLALSRAGYEVRP